MPTYRNDGSVAYRVRDTDLEAINVIPGHSVETYDSSVPSDFTLTAATPCISKRIHVSGEDSFTDALCPKGNFNVSVSGQFTGTVRLLRSFDSFITEKTMDVFTNSLEDDYNDPDPNAQYKIGVRANELSVGAVDVILSLS
jgi:hypothetical protein